MFKEEEIYSHIAKQIASMRSAHKRTQEQLAASLHVASNTISRWETQTYKPSIADLNKLANYFGVDIAWFLPQHAPDTRMSRIVHAMHALPESKMDEVVAFCEFLSSKKAPK